MEKNITYPKIPVSALIQEGNDLYLFCQTDRAALERVGLDWTLVEKLPDLVKQCSRLEALWQIYKEDAVLATKHLKEYMKDARDLRTAVASGIRDVCREAKIPVPLRNFKSDKSKAALIQDLNDIATVGETHITLLKKTNFDCTLLEKAAKMSVELAAKDAFKAVRKPSQSEQKKVRDRCCKELYELMKTIRKAGKTAGKQNPLILKKYQNTYYYTIRKKM